MSIKKSVSLFTRVLCILLTVFIFSVDVAYARSDVDSITFVAKNQPVISRVCSNANGEAGVTVLVYTAEDGLVSFSNSNYRTLSVKERERFMETVLLAIKESGLSSQIKNKFYNFVAEQDTTTSAAVKFLQSDTSADFVNAASWFKPFGSAAGIVLGFLSLCIFLFIGLSIILDIFYLAVPMFRMFIEKDKGKPRVISNEAYSSAMEAERGSSYQSSVSLYLKRRIPALIVVCIAVGYLISGQIYNMVVYFIDSFTWVIDW